MPQNFSSKQPITPKKMEKYQNKYRIPSARAEWWNYGSNGAYFITICTNHRIHYFGKIVNQNMVLSELGKSAESCWYDIPNHFPFVQLAGFVVMPNHVHGIIIIDKQSASPVFVKTQNIASRPIPNPKHTIEFDVETQNIAALQLPIPIPKNKFGPQSQNLASIIRGYKIGVTKYAKKSCTDFQWQARYHDHVIRSEAEYLRINYYIAMNPENWDKDIFFKTL